MLKKFKEYFDGAEIHQELFEATLVRLFAHTKTRSIGIISASRGRYGAEENNIRSEKLKADIRENGFGYYKLKGHYIEGYGTDNAKDFEERTFLIIGKEGDDNGKVKGFLKKYGAKYNQESVLYKPFNSDRAYLIGTSDVDEDGNPVKPGLGVEEDQGEFVPNKLGRFYSKMKGKPFVFESYEMAPSFFSELSKHSKKVDS